jgi:TolB-like protein
MNRSKKIFLRLPALLFAAAVLFAACRGGYSFSGTSISPEVKTISITYFQNLAPVVMPTLSNTLTEALNTKFRRQTKLEFVNENGDLHFEGEVTGYDVVSKAIQANEMAALSTLKITVRVRFSNTLDEKQSYDQSFSAEADFSASQSLDAVQDRLVVEIVDILAENIFNTAVANW